MMVIKAFICFMLLLLLACAETPVRHVATLTATAIEDLENEMQAKLDAEKSFAKQIVKDGKIAAEWNIKLQNEVSLLRSIQEFSDIALTERSGVPRILIQDFLRSHNERSRQASASETQAIAAEESRLSVTFKKVVFQRARWREAREATLKLARKRSDKERFKLLLEMAQKSWQTYKKSLNETISEVSEEEL